MMNQNRPKRLLYQGQNGDYFGTDSQALPTNVHPRIQEVGLLLTGQGLTYLGQLTCSQFSLIEVYAYATSDRKIAISLMLGDSGVNGIDCVSKLTDGSFLTTTTVKVLNNAYDEQRLFRLSFPGLNPVELLEQHRFHLQEFEGRYGAVQPVFADLWSIAQIIDEYTTRQKSNVGHGFFQLAGGFAQAQVANMMDGGMSEEEEFDDVDDDELDLDRIEYDENEVTPLIRAILADDIAEIENFLADGADLNPTAWNGATPLVAAVYRGDRAIVEKLIAAGADVNKLDFYVNAHPIGMAIKQNTPDLVQRLLDAGASPEGGDLEDTGLAVAIRYDRLSILEMLLAAGANPNSGMEDDYRAIMLAALYGNLDMVQMLVAHGADVNAWSQGQTAIMSAARGGYQGVYDYLYPLLDEETRRYADRHGEKEIARAIKRKARAANKLGEKLADAALYGNVAKVKKLLAQGADPNTIASCGKSPLMMAAMYGHKEAIEALLDAGADPNLGSDEEFEERTTALMQIASSFFAQNRAEVIKLLADRGADVNKTGLTQLVQIYDRIGVGTEALPLHIVSLRKSCKKNDRGQTALMLAESNVDAVKALIEAGADVNLRDKDGNTAMMLGTWAVQQLLRQAGASEAGLNDVALVKAANRGDLVKVEELLQAGANVNYLDGSALVAAAGKGHLAIVDRLIEAGADVKLGWKTGLTPIAEAAYQGYLNIVERLLNAGADPFQRTHDDEFYDALDYARQGQAEGHHKGTDHAAIIERFDRLSSQ